MSPIAFPWSFSVNQARISLLLIFVKNRTAPIYYRYHHCIEHKEETGFHLPGSKSTLLTPRDLVAKKWPCCCKNLEDIMQTGSEAGCSWIMPSPAIIFGWLQLEPHHARQISLHSIWTHRLPFNWPHSSTWNDSSIQSTMTRISTERGIQTILTSLPRQGRRAGCHFSHLPKADNWH